MGGTKAYPGNERIFATQEQVRASSSFTEQLLKTGQSASMWELLNLLPCGSSTCFHVGGSWNSDILDNVASTCVAGGVVEQVDSRCSDTDNIQIVESENPHKRFGDIYSGICPGWIFSLRNVTG